MINVHEIETVSAIIQFAVWSLVVYGLCFAIFWSFLAGDLRVWLARMKSEVLRETQVLRWEIQNRVAWNEDLAKRNPHAARVELDDEQVAEREQAFKAAMKRSRPARLLNYALECRFCQFFWVSLGLYPCTRSIDGVGTWLLTAFAYCGASLVWLSILQSWNQDGATNADVSKRGGCSSGNCGK